MGNCKTLGDLEKGKFTSTGEVKVTQLNSLLPGDWDTIDAVHSSDMVDEIVTYTWTLQGNVVQTIILRYDLTTRLFKQASIV